MNMDFNESFNDQGEKPRFLYKRNPLLEHAWQIFEYKEEKADYEPVGDYTLIDTDEPIEITEKKVSNLVTIMNEKEGLIDLSNLTETRILYNIVADTPESDKQKVVFRTYDGDGVSKENAVLEIEKGVLDDS